MRPIKASSLKEGIGKEVGVHQNVADDFINFYYEEVRRSLVDLDFPSIYVENLGMFSIRRNKLKSKIRMFQSILESINKETYSGFAKFEEVKESLENLEKVMIVYDKLLEEKKLKNG